MSTARSIFTAGVRETTCDFCPHRAVKTLNGWGEPIGIAARNGPE